MNARVHTTGEDAHAAEKVPHVNIVKHFSIDQINTSMDRPYLQLSLV